MTTEEDVAELRAFITTHDNIPPVDAALDRIVSSHDEHAEMRLENERLRNKAVVVMLAAEKERDELITAVRAFLDWEWDELAMTDPDDGSVGSQMTAEESLAFEEHVRKLRSILQRTEPEVSAISATP